MEFGGEALPPFDFLKKKHNNIHSKMD